jgi:hypothetical protein
MRAGKLPFAACGKLPGRSPVCPVKPFDFFWSARTTCNETLNMKIMLNIVLRFFADVGAAAMWLLIGTKMVLNIVLGSFADLGAELMWLLIATIRRQSDISFVYVNQDGSVREVSAGEKAYLAQRFHPFDGARPYIKSRYWSWDNWGSRSGYLKRSRVPFRITIQPVRPDYDTAIKELKEDILGPHRASGDVIVRNDNGSIMCSPNMNISRKERFERARKYQLEAQARREALAKVRA